MNTRMRMIVSLVALVGVLLVIFVGIARADEIQFEEGATFDGGICWEADGTEGITTIDGQCMTPADYDEMFSYENLAATPSQTIEGKSVAEAYGITPDSPRASERSRIFMGDDLGTFTDYVVTLHGQVAL